MYAKWIPSIEIPLLGKQVNEMTCYQVPREETSINLTSLVNRSNKLPWQQHCCIQPNQIKDLLVDFTIDSKGVFDGKL